MRLIDTENFCKEHQDFPSVVYVALSKSPTIDPIHAAGGCRCAECKNFVYEHDRPNRLKNHPPNFGRCGYLDFAHKDTDFCSYGERKDGAKQKEAGTDVHQQDD